MVKKKITTFWTAVKQLEELSDGKNSIDIENVKVPYVLKNKLLMKEGTHNGVFYPGNELKNAEVFNERFGLYHDHADASMTWIGEVIPKTFDDTTKEMFGDVVIVDKQMAMNLAYGAKLGLSPTIDVDKLERPDGPPVALDPQFLSWSTVITPAVRETMLNSQGEGGNTKMELNEKDISKVAERVVEVLSANDEKIKADAAKDTKVTEELDKQKADNVKITEELDKYKQAETDSQVLEIRSKEEFLSKKEDEFEEGRDRVVGKMTPEERTTLSSTLDRFISSREELEKFTSFVKDHKEKNPSATVSDAAKSFRAEQAKLTKETEDNPSTETPANADTPTDGVTQRQSLSFDGKPDGKQPKKSKQELSDAHTVKMHAEMLKAQGGK